MGALFYEQDRERAFSVGELCGGRLVLTAACIDVGYIALCMWLGSWPLTLVNVGSIALYLAAYALIRHRKNAWGSR